MSVHIQILSVAEALESAFLPWQNLYADGSTSPLSDPRWWKAWAQCHILFSSTPQLAAVFHQRSLIGLLPITLPQHAGTSRRSQSLWQVHLGPGVGVIGKQRTATLNAIFGHLQQREFPALGFGNVQQAWQLQFDPQDHSLTQRLHTAFRHTELQPDRGRPVPWGWSLRRTGVPVNGDGAEPPSQRSTPALPSTGTIGSVQAVDLSKDRALEQRISSVQRMVIQLPLGQVTGQVQDFQPMLAWVDQHPGFRIIRVEDDSQCWDLGFVNLQTRKTLGHEVLEQNPDTWMLWCVIESENVSTPLPNWDHWAAAAHVLAAKHLLLPNALAPPMFERIVDAVPEYRGTPKNAGRQKKMELDAAASRLSRVACQIPLEANGYGIERYVLQQRSFYPASVWQRFWQQALPNRPIRFT